MTGTTVAEAQGKKAGKAEQAPPAATTPPVTNKGIVLIPRVRDPKGKAIAWGMDYAQVASVINKVIEESYAEEFKKTPTGPQQERLEAKIAQDKFEFLQRRVDFGTTPTSIDRTPLKGEYTYNNGEAMLTYERGTTKTYFFFIKKRLWKIIDERTLGQGSKSGATFTEALSRLVTLYGVPGRVLQADPDNGRENTEVDWKDASTHLRAVQRGDTEMAIILEDNATLGNLDALRSNKATDDSGIDPAVAAAVRKGEPEPPPKQDDKNKKK
ncbi:Hypothetical protein CAP_5062 [Chondromyces apiculatus DSM 436]|uniref:Uncharacterized protein n=2 Tax=Chondromyces apiculatus TaxID=51 RepID=A0A017T5U9_9BACT|nr:Hypothetical protein CAP_5062 [Chondromyces apiculatus DSM 436]